MTKKASIAGRVVKPARKKTIITGQQPPPAPRKKTSRRASRGDSASESQTIEQQLAQREAELAILNSVGEAMSKTLDVKTVTRIVGDKVRDIFGAEVTEILLHDARSGLIHVPYAFAKDYQEVEPFAMGSGLTSKVILSRQPLLLRTIQEAVVFGMLAPTEEDKTVVHGRAYHRGRRGTGCGQRAKLSAECLQ
jgi:hypothetical protein